jgi:SNF2 family DNA or RNA helicase
MAYGRLTIDRLERGLYVIRSGYFSRALTDACKATVGMRYDGQIGWYGYPDAVEVVRKKLDEKGVRLDGELPDPLDWKTGALTVPVATRGVGDLVLRPYQQEGVKFLVARANEGCLLADSMRLGKTAQVTVAARAFKEKTLVICPPQVVGVWGRPPNHLKPGEIAKWWPDAWRGLDDRPFNEDSPFQGVVVLEGVEPAKWQEVFRKLMEIPEDKRSEAQKRELAEADAVLEDFVKGLQNAVVVVAHNAIVYAWVEVLLRWGLRTLILDEVHDFASYDARRSIAAKELARVAVRRYGLSGTPLLNRPRDLHNPIDILCPGRAGVFFREQGSSFAKEFCNSHQKTVGQGPEAKTVWDHDGKSNEESLRRRMSFMMLRRVAKEVDSQLPEIARQIVDVKITAKKAVMPSFETLKNKEHLRKVLDLAADGKFPQIGDLVLGHLEEGEKVLVFCHRRRFAEAVVDHVMSKGYSASFVHGDLSLKERERRIFAAEKAKGPYVLAVTIESCSTGIDLSFASVTVFAELTYEPAELSQAEARTYKVESGRKRLVQYVIAKGTGDELILRSVISKLQDFEAIIGETGDRMRGDLSKKERPEDALARLADALTSMTKKKKKAG